MKKLQHRFGKSPRACRRLSYIPQYHGYEVIFIFLPKCIAHEQRGVACNGAANSSSSARRNPPIREAILPMQMSQEHWELQKKVQVPPGTPSEHVDHRKQATRETGTSPNEDRRQGNLHGDTVEKSSISSHMLRRKFTVDLTVVLNDARCDIRSRK